MTAPTTTPDITVTNDGRVITLTCPAGHTYIHGRTPMPELLAPWIAGHEGCVG